MSTLEERRAVAAAKLAQLDAQLARKKAREKAAEKKVHDHVMIQLGGALLYHAGVGYRKVDAEAANEFFRMHGDKFREMCCLDEEMEPREAREAWEEQRIRNREEKKAARRAAGLEKEDQEW